MTEVLLGLICFRGLTGCVEASQAYFEQNSQLRGAVYSAAVIVENRVPPEMLAVAPLIYASLGGEATLSLGYGAYARIGPLPQLLFRHDF